MATVYHEGVNHGHKPSGRWPEVQKAPNSPGAEWTTVTVCTQTDPPGVVEAAMFHLSQYDQAVAHIRWYLNGTGGDYVENDLLEQVLKNDPGVRVAIGVRLPDKKSSGVYTGHFKLEQGHYGTVNTTYDYGQDARNSWGAVDRLDVEADYDKGTLHVWFKDRYEWHPYYPALYKPLPGDFARETNCVHAAFVEMKLQGAADFWMKGEATVSLDPFRKSKPTDIDLREL